ncbi:MAG TPA: response regulator transcription factor [Desulfosalsimonadaceae bacterium]|nr:response regulator transcription factor [Desulfosalsimonadaceae bacterium]
MDTIKILLADHHLMVREGLKALLEREGLFEVVGDAANSQEALEHIKSEKPDIVLLDLTLPILTRFDMIQLIKDTAAQTSVIVVSNSIKQSHVRQALQGGAKGYILKTSAFSELVEAIQAVDQGSYYLSSEIKTDIIDHFIKQTDDGPVHDKYNLLTRREKEVFRMLISGNTTDEIAQLLFISPKTVAKHRSNLMEKLEIFNIASLVRYAMKIGVIDSENELA